MPVKRLTLEEIALQLLCAVLLPVGSSELDGLDDQSFDRALRAAEKFQKAVDEFTEEDDDD